MTFDQEMKTTATVLSLAIVLTAHGRADLEPVGEAGPQVRVVVCGEVSNPKEIIVSSGAGVRGALSATNNTCSDYGWTPRTLIRRGDRVYRIGPPNQPDVRLEEGDILEVPVRAPFQEMAAPQRILIEIDQPARFTESTFTQSQFDFQGVWRTNWLDGTEGRELRLTDKHVYHSAFVSPCPEDLRVATPDAPRESRLLDHAKTHLLVTFREIRAIDQEPKHRDRELEIVEAISQRFGGTAYILRRDLPEHPWVMTPFETTKKQRVEQAGAEQPAIRPESDSEGVDKPQPEAEGRSR